MAVVECDWARLANGQEISIAEATSGANGYFCLGCGHELQARKGLVNEAHFAHLAAGSETERLCEYSSETYRHDQAKKLLRHLKKVRVPAVYAACPPNYHGLLPRLAEARDVEAAQVLSERNIYVDEQGEVRFARRHRNEPFDDDHGKRLLLGRPDVIFLDEQRRPILLIEIYATHKVDREKITRLRLLGIDAIEIYIPRHFDSFAIERLFSVTIHTHWLYNAQQANAGPLAPDSHLLASGSASAAELESRLSGRAETLKCRRSRVGHALRAIRSCLERADIAAVHAEISATQATGEEFTAGLEAKREQRDERLGAAVRQRVTERKAALAAQARELAAAEAALSREESELAQRTSGVEEQLRDLVDDLTHRIKRAESAVEDEFGDRMASIRDERSRRRAELNRLSREAAAVISAATKLGPEETELEHQESILAIAARTNRRGRDYAAGELRKVELATQRVEEQTAILRRIESEIA
jgi:hypothetical protein